MTERTLTGFIISEDAVIVYTRAELAARYASVSRIARERVQNARFVFSGPLGHKTILHLWDEQNRSRGVLP